MMRFTILLIALILVVVGCTSPVLEIPETTTLDGYVAELGEPDQVIDNTNQGTWLYIWHGCFEHEGSTYRSYSVEIDKVTDEFLGELYYREGEC